MSWILYGNWGVTDAIMEIEWCGNRVAWVMRAEFVCGADAEMGCVESVHITVMKCAIFISPELIRINSEFPMGL